MILSMVKLTKAIIKKYGITKKAWAVARGKKRAKPKKRKVKKVVRRKNRTMAKKKKTKSRRTKSYFGVNLKTNVLYPAAAGAASGIIDGIVQAVLNFVPMDLSAVPQNYLQAAFAILLKKGVPIRQLKPILTKYMEAKIFNGTSNLTQGLTFGFGTTSNGGGW